MKPPPDNDFTAALAVADEAMRRVLGDPAVWREEAARTAAPPLPWLPAPAKGYAGLLRLLAIVAVQQVVLARAEAELGEDLPRDDPRLRHFIDHAVEKLDPGDAETQVVLRVVARAVAAADVAMVEAMPGVRLTGKRALENWIKRREVEGAIRSGLPRAEALALLGFSRAAAYRSLKRRR